MGSAAEQQSMSLHILYASVPAHVHVYSSYKPTQITAAVSHDLFPAIIFPCCQWKSM